MTSTELCVDAAAEHLQKSIEQLKRKKMQIKCLEIRDTATFIAVMAIRLEPRDEAEKWLLNRAGYQTFSYPDSDVPGYVILVKLDGIQAQYDPYEWGTARTMQIAHRFILEHWVDLKSGSVVDVEHILELKPEPKQSENPYGPEEHHGQV